MSTSPATGGSPVLAVMTALGALGVIVSLWLPWARARSFEDFYDVYGGRLGIPDLEALEAGSLDPLPGWFFPIAAAGQVGFALLALAFAAVSGLRPELLAAHGGLRVAAAATGTALVAWVTLLVAVSPGLMDPWVDIAGPFDLLAGAWSAIVSTAATAASLLALAWRSRGAGSVRQ